MTVTAQVKARVENKIREGIALAEAKYKQKFAMPTIQYDLRGTTAGTANYNTWTIRLNAVLLNENTDEFIERTVPHELAHLITDRVYPEAHHGRGIVRTRRGFRREKREVHGPNWQSVCLVLGMTDITRCHQYDTTNSKVVKSTSRTIPWKCTGCGTEILLSPKKSHQLDLKSDALWHRGCRGSRLVRATAAPKPTPRENFFAGNVPPIQLKVPALPVPAQPVKSAEPAMGGSKIDICKTLYLKFSMLSRAEVLAKFKTLAGCTDAGAATYYATCKKLYG